MFIYNTTTKVDHSVINSWLQWQMKIYIPEVMASGFFTEHRFYKLLDHDDDEGAIYVTQFLMSSKEDYHQYLQQCAHELQQKALEQWDGKIVSFSTLLQNVQ